MDNIGLVVLLFSSANTSLKSINFLLTFRNGRFLLHSSSNIFASSTLLECEEALNSGTMTAADVFVSLKTRSILHLFACIGRFLGLQVIYVSSISLYSIYSGILRGCLAYLNLLLESSAYLVISTCKKKFRLSKCPLIGQFFG